jgi:hypothetical protein
MDVAIAVVLPSWLSLGRLKLIDDQTGDCSMNGSSMANGEYGYGVVAVYGLRKTLRPIGKLPYESL